MADSTEINVRTNGPLLIKGNFGIKDARGQEFDLSGREAIALCRCGQSANRPFCDGSHNQIGFQSSEKATVTKS